MGVTGTYVRSPGRSIDGAFPGLHEGAQPIVLVSEKTPRQAHARSGRELSATVADRSSVSDDYRHRWHVLPGMPDAGDSVG
jgi:hypothetical protein